jgi:hypothetical protein
MVESNKNVYSLSRYNSLIAAHVRFTFIAIAAALPTLGLLKLTVLNWELTLLLALCVMLGVGLLWSLALSTRGEVRVKSDSLKVKSLYGTMTISFRDIRSVHVTTMAEEGGLDLLWLRLLRIPATQELVVLNLARSLRFGPIGNRSGTDMVGLPSGVAKKVRLAVDLPRELADDLREQLRSAA